MSTTSGRMRVRWVPGKLVNGVPYDTPVQGYRNYTANTLRLWRAEAPESFDFAVFNRGDYYGAVNQKVTSENITKVLYPNDDQARGKELRLEQQYFFVSCSLQDMFRILAVQSIPIERFHEKFAVQLNDTHPSVAIAELMRLLVDVHAMDWDQAWDITRRTMAYTNHTILPEALECWPIELFGRVLPRHLEIIYEINARFLDDVRIRNLGDEARVADLSLIDERGERYVRMAHLACVGSHAVNGVAALHTELLKSKVLRDFHELWPRAVLESDERRHAAPLARARESAADGAVDRNAGRRLGARSRRARRSRPLARRLGVPRALGRDQACQQGGARGPHRNALRSAAGDPDSLFDVQVKRFHEYKRQHMNILHVIALYHRLKSGADATSCRARSSSAARPRRATASRS